MAAFQARAATGGQVVIVFIGHGAGADAESRLSIPGPDVTVADVQRWLAGFPRQRAAFVALASGSGDMLPILATPGRVVITATKTSFERNESKFGEYFVHALTADVADADKDGRVSLLEAFRYAQRETKRVYDDASKIQTEHAQLDDDGVERVGAGLRLLLCVQARDDLALRHSDELRLYADDDLRRAIRRFVPRLKIADIRLKYVIVLQSRGVAVHGQYPSAGVETLNQQALKQQRNALVPGGIGEIDRKSTRLNSSHT